MTDVSPTRLYLGNLPREANKENVREYFEQHGAGKITEVKIMSGFGFIEYEDPLDARDIVPTYHGTEFLGSRLTVQFARGSRPRTEGHERPNAPRPRRTQYRMNISGLPPDTSWQDLKDFARKSGCDVVYSETARGGERAFVEFESATDLSTAVDKLNGELFKDVHVSCKPDIQETVPAPPSRNRSRSPGRPSYPPRGYEDYRYPPRGGRDDYYGVRQRSPYGGRRDYYDARPRYDDAYQPRAPPRYPDDGYERPPPRRDPYEEYDARAYAARPPPPHAEPYRREAPPRAGYYDDRAAPRPHW